MSGTILRTGVAGLLLFSLCALPMSAAVSVDDRSAAEATEAFEGNALAFVYNLFQSLLSTNVQNSEIVLPNSDGAPTLPNGDGSSPPPDTDGPVLYGPGIEPMGAQ